MTVPVTFGPEIVAASLPPLSWTPTSMDLFRFSALTWNAHRIHYDQMYAESEGYRGLVVQSHLHAAHMVRALDAWAPPTFRLVALNWRNLRPAFVGDTLIWT